MADFNEFKRMNYFTGFFTTADDWRGEQSYHREKIRLHNRGLHTPGVLKGVAFGLRVKGCGGLNIEILPGGAIDGEGNELFLSQPRTLSLPSPSGIARVVYVGLRYAEEEDERVINTAVPEYSGFKRIRETPELFVSTSRPDNLLVIELARIDLQPGATVIADATDPAAPGGNQIDLRYVRYAGAVPSPAAGKLSPELQERLVQLMGRTRKDFAALALKFPTPSCGDVRQAAITIEMLGRSGSLAEVALAGLFASLADVERDTGQEIGAYYAGVARIKAYQDYSDCVDRLLDAVSSGLTENIFARQDQVAEAARELSEAVMSMPLAEAGASQTVSTGGLEGVVALDASGSLAYGGRTIARYRWELKGSDSPPVGDAGSDFVVSTGGEEASVILNASGAVAPSRGGIARYIWDKK